MLPRSPFSHIFAHITTTPKHYRTITAFMLRTRYETLAKLTAVSRCSPGSGVNIYALGVIKKDV